MKQDQYNYLRNLRIEDRRIWPSHCPVARCFIWGISILLDAQRNWMWKYRYVGGGKQCYMEIYSQVTTRKPHCNCKRNTNGTSRCKYCHFFIHVHFEGQIVED
ncbi:hypothetical protein GE061_003982 [Apolygus lucorum]|uniref:Uncharacterized protein n=1 Tax=Apolygus lucorum TaxID=248454 RepID=A0A8S9WXD2_APOLU|nr:hypothetical protein GE061_003982 [Apolygus lucorum]